MSDNNLALNYPLPLAPADSILSLPVLGSVSICRVGPAGFAPPNLRPRREVVMANDRIIQPLDLDAQGLAISMTVIGRPEQITSSKNRFKFT